MNAPVSTIEPNISSEIDALIDQFEEAGGNWHVMGGSGVVDPYLAFSLPADGIAPEHVISAMLTFQHWFHASASVRKHTIEHAISIGAYYVELGNPNPVVSEGRTVQ